MLKKRINLLVDLVQRLKISDKPKNAVSTNYGIGDAVIHKKFGEGKVLDITSDSVKVEFSEVGVKTLLIEYANLTRKD